MICQHCGNKINTSDAFCGRCGKKVALKAPSKPEKQKPRKKWLIMIGCLVLTSAVVAVLLLQTSHQADNDDSKDASDPGIQETHLNQIAPDASDPVVQESQPNQTAPDAVVKLDIQTIFADRKRDFSDEYEIVLEHSPDTDAHLDSVYFEVYDYREYGAYITYSNAVYQYFKDSDTWKRIQNDKLERRIELNYGAFIGQSFSISDGRDSYGNVYIRDFNDDSVTLDYDLAISTADKEEPYRYISGSDTIITNTQHVSVYVGEGDVPYIEIPGHKNVELYFLPDGIHFYR